MNRGEADHAPCLEIEFEIDTILVHVEAPKPVHQANLVLL